MEKDVTCSFPRRAFQACHSLMARQRSTTFLEMEDEFSELLSVFESLPKMPTAEDFDEWEDEEPDSRNFKRMNEQLYNFLCLNLKDEALNMVKI